MFLNTAPLQLNALSASPTLDVVCSFTDHATGGASSASTAAQITSTGLATLVAAPSAGTTRQVQEVSVYNAGTTAQRVQPTLDGRAAGPTFSLGAGESLAYSERDGGWVARTASGVDKRDASPAPLTGYVVNWFKTGTAPEAAGVDYLFAKDAGSPGAWSPGTPGVAGRATDGTLAPDAGCLPVRTPPSGAAYLARYEQMGSVGHRAYLMDALWVNSGLVVTTTTAQTVASVTFPARDLFGNTAGVGVRLGIYVSVATTNAAAVTTITASYTNDAGVAGHTATIASFPATCVAGSVVPFRLQAGDTGVRSVESITLGTTLTAGTIHLLAYKEIAATPAIAAFIGNEAPATLGSLGVRLYPGVCLLPACVPSSATALTVYGSANIQEVVG